MGFGGWLRWAAPSDRAFPACRHWLSAPPALASIFAGAVLGIRYLMTGSLLGRGEIRRSE